MTIEPFVFETTHRVYYNTKHAVPIKDVIVALQGLEGLLKPLPALMGSLTNVQIHKGEFFIQRIDSGSLIEDVVIRFFFKDRESLDAFIDKISENKKMKASIIGVSLAALAGYGLHMAVADKAAPSITANNSIIIQTGAGALNISEKAFSDAVNGAVVDKKGLAENALKLIGPARSDATSSVRFDNEISISSDAISASPHKLDLDANERVEHFNNVILTIRATNLDSKKSGWAGRLGNRDERLPIELDPAVAEADIFGRTSISVDADLIYKEHGRSKELKPKRIYVRRVYRSDK